MNAVPPATVPTRAPEMSGTHIVLFVLFPAALIVGMGFLLLTPVVTAKKPGHLYVGMRFSDEATLQFVDRNAANPLTLLEVSPAKAGTAVPAATFEGLRRGKNIIDLSALEDGLYFLRFSTPGYQPAEVQMARIDGDFRKDDQTRAPGHALVMDQFVGLEMQALPLKLD